MQISFLIYRQKAKAQDVLFSKAKTQDTLYKIFNICGCKDFYFLLHFGYRINS